MFVHPHGTDKIADSVNKLLQHFILYDKEWFKLLLMSLSLL